MERYGWMVALILLVLPEAVNWYMGRYAAGRRLSGLHRALFYAGAVFLLILLNAFAGGEWVGWTGLLAEASGELLLLALGAALLSGSSLSRPAPAEEYHHSSGRRAPT